MERYQLLDWTEVSNWCLSSNGQHTVTISSSQDISIGPSVKHFSAGAMAGCTATFGTFWLDTVKVRMQADPHRFRNATHCLVKTVKRSGPIRLYHGITPALVASTCRSAVLFTFFGINERLVRQLAGIPEECHLSVIQYAGTGALTGICASLCICPVEIIKMRLQSGKNRTGTIPVMTMNIINKAGVRGMYRGLSAMWAKDVPGAFMYFGGYYGMKTTWLSMSGQEQLGLHQLFLCGMTGGFLYSAVYPFDSLKTRIQIRCSRLPARGLIKTTKHLIRSQGFMSLCRGMRAYMVRLPLFSGIQFLTFEMITNHLLK